MAQFVQLQKTLEAFRTEGIEVVALTYDSPQQQQAFVEKNQIDYPFLSDVEAYSVNALGILNQQYQPGDKNYGIPYPGIFILNPKLEIVGKIFVDGYKTRVSADAVLAYALESLNER